MIRALSALGLLLLAGCAGQRVIQGGGMSIAEAQAAQGRPRVAVGVVADRTEGRLAGELGLLNAKRTADQQMQPAAVTGGIRDMLTAALFESGRYTVIERDALDLALTEQEFSQSRRAGDLTRVPTGRLEGADWLLLCAVTGFDAGAGGGALPIPLPLGRSGDFAVVNVSAKRGWVAMDLRLVEVSTGRVLAASAVEGRNWKLGVDFSGFVGVGHRNIKLPGLLKYFSNTPVEEALQKMVTAALAQIDARDEAPRQN